MNIKYEIVEGAEEFTKDDYNMNFICQIVSTELKLDNTPGGEDVLVFNLKVIPKGEAECS